MPIDELFVKLVPEGRRPGEIGETDDRRVFMTDGDEAMITGQMPMFAGGRPYGSRTGRQG